MPIFKKKTAMALILRRYQPMVGWLVSFFLVGYVPRTHMTLVSIEKGLVLEGLPSKIEVSWVLGIYIYICPKYIGEQLTPTAAHVAFFV